MIGGFRAWEMWAKEEEEEEEKHPANRPETLGLGASGLFVEGRGNRMLCRKRAVPEERGGAS